MGTVHQLQKKKQNRAARRRVEFPPPPRHPSSQRTDAKSTRIRQRMRTFAEEIQRATRRHTFDDSLSTSERVDSWLNAVTGIGNPLKDKRFGASFVTEKVSDFEAEDLWRGSDIAARVVETAPDEIVRGGFEIQIQPGEEDEKEQDEGAGDEPRGDMAPGQSVVYRRRWDGRRKRRCDAAMDVFADDDTADSAKEQSESVKAFLDELDAVAVFGEALKFERAYGGSAIFMGLEDGERDLSKPLNYAKIRNLGWLTVLMPIELIPYQWYADPVGPRYGEPELYWMQRLHAGGIGSSPRIPVHESRLILFPGVCVSKRQRQEHWGWGDSVMVRIRNVLRDFESSWDSAAVLLQDFAQMVIKIAGLSAALAKDKGALLKARLEAMELAKSIVRAVVIDKDEEAKRETTTVTGLPDLLDRFAVRMAAAADMPVTRLMGKSPSGLSSTGENEIRNWLDSVAASRSVKLKPRINKLARVMFAASEGPTDGVEPDKWSVKFGSLWQLDELQQSTARKNDADADVGKVNAGILMPEEVAESRHGGDEYGKEIKLNRKIRQAYDDQQAKAEKLQQQQAQLEAEARAKAAAAGPGAAPGGQPPKPGAEERKAPGDGGDAPAGDDPKKKRGDAALTPEHALASIKDVQDEPGDVALKSIGLQDGTSKARALWAELAANRPEGAEEEVDPRELFATQATVQRSKVAAMLTGDGKRPDDRPPYAVRDAGKLFLIDGHHAAAAALLRGEKLGVEIAARPGR